MKSLVSYRMLAFVHHNEWQACMYFGDDVGNNNFRLIEKTNEIADEGLLYITSIHTKKGWWYGGKKSQLSPLFLGIQIESFNCA